MSINIRSDCSICYNPFSNTRTPGSLKCGHIFCEGCLYRVLNEKSQCPHCKLTFTVDDIRTLHVDPVPPTPVDPIVSPLTSQSFQIFVRDFENKSQTINVTKDEDVLTLKGKVQGRTGVPVEYQRLIYSGHQLEDGKPLSKYNIGPMSTLHLVSRLRGGWF